MAVLCFSCGKHQKEMGTLATHDNNKLRDMLMQQVYGPDLDQAKSNLEVLSVIKSMEQGPARDQALNMGMKSEDFLQLMEFELAQRHAVEAELTSPATVMGAHALEVSGAVLASTRANIAKNSPEHVDVYLSGSISYLASAVLSSDESGDALYYVDADGKPVSEDEDPLASHGDPVAEERQAAAAYHKSLMADRAAQAAAAGAGDGSGSGSISSGEDGASSGSSVVPSALAKKRFLKVRGQRYSISQEVLDYIKELSAKHNTLSKIASEVKARFDIEITQSRLRNILRFGLSEVKAFKEQKLRPCYPVIYIVVEKIRMFTSATLVVEHPFYIMMGMNIDGTHDLLDVSPFPRDYMEAGSEGKMWVEAFKNLKERGLQDPIYVVTGDVHEFKKALHEVYPQAIYQHSLRDIVRQASEPMTTMERVYFFNDCRVLYSCKTLLECMKALLLIENRWTKKYPTACQLIRDHWIFFEQYYAANHAVRVSIRTTKTLDLLLNHLHRDIRIDSQNYLYRDALHVIARIIELDRFVTGMRHPVQWKRALRYMLTDSYMGKILGKYITLDDVKLSPRSIKRDKAAIAQEGNYLR